MSKKNLYIRLAIFFVLTFLAIHNMDSQWLERSVLKPVSLLTAKVAAQALSDLGYEDVARRGTIVRTSGRSYNIAGECAGLQIVLLYGAAVVIFPASLGAKAAGLGLGAVFSLVLNTVRILVIIIGTASLGGTLWFLHIVVGQAMVIVGTLAAFLVWAGWAAGQDFPLLSRGWSWRLAGWFALGFLFSYAVHFAVMASPLGPALAGAIPYHAAALLSVFTEARFSGDVLRTSGAAVRIVPGCMSGPLAVFACAAVFMLPLRAWKRFVFAALAYVPVFYSYYLMRTATLAVSLGGNRDQNFLYNYFGVSLICLAGLAFYWAFESFSWRSRQPWRSGLWMLAGASAGLAVSWVIALVNQEYVLPVLGGLVADNGRMAYDVKRSLSGMANVQAFMWTALVLWAPGWTAGRRAALLVLGVAAACVHSWLVVALVEGTGLAPPYYLIKLWTVALPWAAMWMAVKGMAQTADTHTDA